MFTLSKKSENKLECLLCPHFCKLTIGQTGICGIRKNTGREIELLTYGTISGYSLDPVEKKPLYHFFPGYNILSIGSFGCNMRCDFCQNHSISQRVPENPAGKIGVNEIVKAALEAEKNIGIAFTYNEPIIWFEFVRDTSMAVKEAGLSTVMVSNGYVNREPLEQIIQFTDAFNIDLKAFNNDFYRKLTGAGIEPVKNCMKQISRAGKHLEITTLIISEKNEDANEMELQCEWIAGELGKDVPLHLSKYFPNYKRNDPATSENTLRTLYEVASRHLNNVYLGNITSLSGQTTKCPQCGEVVTIRSGYQTRLQNLDSSGKCTSCGTPVYRYYAIS